MLAGWLRAIPLIAGISATGLMVVVGCTKVSDGTVAVDGNQASEYRTSVSSSRSAAAVTSSQREAKRRESLTRQAVHKVCETLSTSSADAVNNLNAYVDAAKTGGDIDATVGPAKDTLTSSADLVAAGVTDAIPQNLKDALNAWVVAARDAATAVDGAPTPEDFNNAVAQVNTARTAALDLCDATY